MSCILSRGDKPIFAGGETCYITAWEIKPPPLDARVLHFALTPNGQASAHFYQHGSSQICELSSDLGLWHTSGPDDARVYFAALPWGTLPDLHQLATAAATRVFYIPWRGWRESVWYDGPLIWLEAGQVQAFSLPGPPAQLPIKTIPQFRPGVMEWILQRAPHAWKQSLAWALRDRLQLAPESCYRLHIHNFAATDALALIGLRLAFPDLNFCWIDDSRRMGPKWKRLAQNLNVQTWMAPAMLAEAIDLPVEPLCRQWSPLAVATFLRELQKSVPLIPRSLFDRLCPD